MTFTRHVFVHESGSREYIFVNGSSKALVVILHGFSESPEVTLRRFYKLKRAGFSLLIPKGSGNPPAWNADFCCGDAVEKNIHDTDFLISLIKFVLKEYFQDSIRAYLT